MRPDWSPDSRRLLVPASTAAGKSGIYEVMPASGQVGAAAGPGPRPVPGGLRARSRSGCWCWPAPTTAGCGCASTTAAPSPGARWQPGRRVARGSHRPGQPACCSPARPAPACGRPIWTWLPPASARSTATGPDAATATACGRWPPMARSVYLEQLQGCAARLAPARPCQSAARQLPGSDPPIGPSGFSLAPRGDVIYVSLAEWDGADIGFMALPSESEKHRAGLVQIVDPQRKVPFGILSVKRFRAGFRITLRQFS